MKETYIFFLLLICSLLVVGCGKKEIDYEKHLISFSYEYGNKEIGFYNYSISFDDNIAHYNISSDTTHIEGEIDKEYIDRIEKIINKYEVLDWDGFNKQKENKGDDIAFSLHIGYDNGNNCSATGYKSYPNNFDKVHKELLKLFNEINY